MGNGEFDPTIDLQSIRESPAWVAVGKEVPHLTAQIGSDTLSEKISEMLLRDPNYFVSGQLHKNYDQWYDMLTTLNTEAKHEVSEWIKNDVAIARFIELRELILSQKDVDIVTLQRFSGKCISMNLVVPVSIEGALRHEIEHWLC